MSINKEARTHYAHCASANGHDIKWKGNKATCTKCRLTGEVIVRPGSVCYVGLLMAEVCGDEKP